jgi:hypothetical protein
VPALRDLKAQCKSPVKASFENAQDCVGIFLKEASLMKTSSTCLLAACLQGNSAAVFANANTKTQQTTPNGKKLILSMISFTNLL